MGQQLTGGRTPASQPDVTGKTISATSAWTLTAGGAVLFILVFLPWMTIELNLEALSESVGRSESLNLLEIQNGLVLVTTLAVIGAGVLVALRKIPLWGVLVLAAAATIHLLITINAVGKIGDAREVFESPLADLGLGENSTTSVSNGLGLWLTLGLSIAVILFSAFAYLTDKVDFESSGLLVPLPNH